MSDSNEITVPASNGEAVTSITNRQVVALPGPHVSAQQQLLHDVTVSVLAIGIVGAALYVNSTGHTNAIVDAMATLVLGYFFGRGGKVNLTSLLSTEQK